MRWRCRQPCDGGATGTAVAGMALSLCMRHFIMMRCNFVGAADLPDRRFAIWFQRENDARWPATRWSAGAITHHRAVRGRSIVDMDRPRTARLTQISTVEDLLLSSRLVLALQQAFAARQPSKQSICGLIRSCRASRLNAASRSSAFQREMGTRATSPHTHFSLRTPFLRDPSSTL